MITNNEKRLTEYELPNEITIIVTLQALKRLDEFFLRMNLDNGETEAGSALGAVLCSEIEIECHNHCTWSGPEDDLIEDPGQSEDDALENGRVFVCPECHTSWALLSANDQSLPPADTTKNDQ